MANCQTRKRYDMKIMRWALYIKLEIGKIASKAIALRLEKVLLN